MDLIWDPNMKGQKYNRYNEVKVGAVKHGNSKCLANHIVIQK